MNPDQRALLTNIIANPNDDAARLVYADYLEENGDEERAKYIRLAVEAEAMPEIVTNQKMVSVRCLRDVGVQRVEEMMCITPGTSVERIKCKDEWTESWTWNGPNRRRESLLRQCDYILERNYEEWKYRIDAITGGAKSVWKRGFPYRASVYTWTVEEILPGICKDYPIQEADFMDLNIPQQINDRPVYNQGRMIYDSWFRPQTLLYINGDWIDSKILNIFESVPGWRSSDIRVPYWRSSDIRVPYSQMYNMEFLFDLSSRETADGIARAFADWGRKKALEQLTGAG